MALGGHELLLIVRAQNQASQALRRVATDAARLGSIQDMHLRRQQMALQNARLLTQRQGILNRVQDIEAQQTKAQTLARNRANRVALNEAGLIQQRARLTRNLSSIEAEAGARNLGMQQAVMTAQATKMQTQLREEAATKRLAGSTKMLKDAEKEGLITTQERGEILSRLERLQMIAQIRNQAAATNIQKLSSRQKEYNKQITEGRSRLASINARMYQNAQTGKQAEQELQRQQSNLSRRMAQAKSDLANADAAIQSNVRGMRNLDKAIRVQRWDKLQTGARIVTHLGRVMQMAGLVGGAALGYLAHGAAQFNSQVTLVATQTGPIGSGFGKIAQNAKFLQTALLGVMRQGTATRDELTAAAYDIFSSLTLPGNNMQQLKTGVGMLRQFNRAAVAGATPVHDVANAVIAVLGAFKNITPTVPHVTKLLQRMFAGVRFGRFTFEELTTVLGTAAPAARAAGQSFDTMIGSLAFLSRPLGINKAAIGFARLSEILSREKMVSGLKDLGVNIVGTNGKLLQMPEIIDRITRKFPQLTKGGVALTQFFKKVSGTEGTIQARRAFVFLAQQLDRYRLVLHQTVSDNNEFSRSQAAMLKTAGVQWGIFINRLRVFALQLGEAVLPGLIKLTKPLQNLAKWFENLDSAQRQSLAKYAMYGSALLLFGGTVIAVGGMIVSFIAILGKLGIAGFGLAAMFVGVIAAVKILRGDWNSLSDAISDGANTMLGSWQGFIAMSSLVVVAALRMRKAMVGLAAMRLAFGGAAAAGAASGGAGLLAGIGGAVATGRLAAMYKAEAGASRLAAGLSGAAAGAAALPGPLKIAAVAVGAGALAAMLWKSHMAGVEEHAKRTAEFNRQVNALVTAPGRQAGRFGGLGLDVRTLIQQKNNLAGVNAQIRQTRREIAQAPRGGRADLRRQLVDLYIQQANAIDSVRTATSNANVGFNAFTKTVVAHIHQVQALGQAQKNLNRLRERILKLPMPHTDAPVRSILGARKPEDLLRSYFKDEGLFQQLADAAHNYRREIEQLTPAAQTAEGKLRSAFSKVLRDMREVHQLPKITPVAREALFRTMTRRGRALTLPEMKAVIHATVDKRALLRLPADVRRIIGRVKTELRVTPHQAKARRDFPAFARTIGRNLPAVQIRVKTEAQGASRVHSKIAQVFRKRIDQPVHIGPVSPDAVGIGQSIAGGIEAGFGTVQLHVAINAHINKTVTEVRKHLKAGSPSKLMRDRIGVPMMEGIIAGVLSKAPELERASSMAVDFFNGPWLTSERFTDAKKKVHVHVKDIIKDLRMQVASMRGFNNAISRLAARGVPLEMLAQLQELGVEGEKMLSKLSGATRKQLRQYVRLWRQAQAQIARSQHASYDQVMSNLSQFLNTAAQNLLDKYNEIKDGIQQSWLDIANINEMGAKQHPLSGTRMLRNAQVMMEQFQQFSSLLTSLSKRGLPLDMVLQLAQMGPAALPILQGLNSMTGDQFDEFVGIWHSAQTKIDKLTKQLMNKQIAEWKKHGANIAVGIISGVMSEQEQLLKFFRKLFRNLLMQARRETKAHSPSKVYEMLGRDIVDGLTMGLNSGNPRVRMPRVAGAGAGGIAPIQMTVNAHHSESLMSTMERAAFRLRNRRV